MVALLTAMENGGVKNALTTQTIVTVGSTIFFNRRIVFGRETVNRRRV